jgi:hypothetical protein
MAIHALIHRWIPRHSILVFGGFLAILTLSALVWTTASAGALLNLAGYFDFSYGSDVLGEPTDGRPESKLWYNDGIWWGILYNSEAGAYHIYRLDWASQTWQDTGVEVDQREDSRSDVLWDEASQKLYVVTHVKQDNPSRTKDSTSWGQVYRYSYLGVDKTYSLDADFPTIVNEDKTKTLVLDKDSTGRLWVTYVSRPTGSSEYKVYVNYTLNGDDTDWGVPFVLPFPEAIVDLRAISSVIAFTDNEGPKVGVMWSNELTGKFYFASHPDSEFGNAGWTLETGPDIPYPANDQLNLKKNTRGQLFAAIKTHAVEPNDTLIGLMTRDVDGTFSFHHVSPADSLDTRPIVALYDGDPEEGDEEVYVFMTSNPTGGAICYQKAKIVSPLSAIHFPGRSCGDPGVAGAVQILSDTEVHSRIDNATTTKQVLNSETDIVILASDDFGGRVYVHTPLFKLPALLLRRSPVGTNSYHTDLSVSVTFASEMDQATIHADSFKVTRDGVLVPGTVTYMPSNRTATFKPTNPFEINTLYTVFLTEEIKNSRGQSLLDAPVNWTFQLVVNELFIPHVSK